MQDNIGAKQMMDIQKVKSISGAVSDEQQRKWSDDLLNRKADDPLHNYDISRIRLNFQIGKGGVVQEVDRTQSIGDKVNNEIAHRVTGRINRESNCAVCIIYGGNRNVMNKLAFGDQQIHENGGNSHLIRKKEIERWAQDVYRFNCEEYGEENVVSFIVHMDETNVHAHCVMTPITPDGRLSAKAIFDGEDMNKSRRKFRELHDQLAKINAKYGLERGDDRTITGAKHRSIEQYRNDLSREIAQKEKAIKSLNSMIGNRQKNISDLETKIATFQGTQEELDSLKAELATIREQLQDKQDKLQETAGKLESLKQQAADKQAEFNDFVYQSTLAIKTMNNFYKGKAAQIALSDIVNEIRIHFQDMPFIAQNIWEETLIGAISQDWHIIENIIGAFLIGISGVDVPEVSVGTGGGSCDNSLKKRDNEDEWEFFERCKRNALSNRTKREMRR